MFSQGLLRRLRSRPSNSATSKPIHSLGSPVRVKLVLFLLLLSLTTAVAARSSDDPPGVEGPSNGKAVDTTQVAAWLTGGVSSSRLARLVAERGLATLPTNNELRQLESAGASKDLLRVLSSGNVESARVGAPI